MPDLETKLQNVTHPENSKSENSKTSKDLYNQNFEMAQLLFHSGRLSKSLYYFEKSMEDFQKGREFDRYLYCCIYVFYILNETQQLDTLEPFKKKLEDLYEKEGLTEKSIFKAFLAYYLIYTDGDWAQIPQELNQGLKIAFDQYDKAIRSENFLNQNELRFEIMFCLYVYCIYYLEKRDYKNCLRELDNLGCLLKDYLNTKETLEQKVQEFALSQDQETYNKLLENLNKKLPQVKMMELGVRLMEITIQMNYTKKYSQADKNLWKLYEEVTKNNSHFMIPQVLCFMSYCQLYLGYNKQAILFYNLAKKNANPERKLFLAYLETLKNRLDMKDHTASELDHYDIVFNTATNKVIEKRRGLLDLKSQFILIDLFRLLVLNQGASFSKEALVKELWRENYSPEVHDNKIYVTIKRLREAVELDSSKPVYICRNSRGYYFSQSAKVLRKED